MLKPRSSQMVAWPWAAPRRRPWRGVSLLQKRSCQATMRGLFSTISTYVSPIGDGHWYRHWQLLLAQPADSRRLSLIRTRNRDHHRLRPQDENVYASLTSVTAATCSPFTVGIHFLRRRSGGARSNMIGGRAPDLTPKVENRWVIGDWQLGQGFSLFRWVIVSRTAATFLAGKAQGKNGKVVK